MVDYAALNVYVAGWSGPAEADPTGRAVVVLEQQLGDREARNLSGSARGLIRERETNSAFELDEDAIEITSDSAMLVRDSDIKIHRAARIYRVGRIEVAPQPEYVIGLGVLDAVQRKLDSTLRDVEAALDHGEGTLEGRHLESIGDSTHVFRLKRTLEDGQIVDIAEPSVALKVLELAEFVDGDAWFEISSLQRFEGEAAAPRLDAKPIGEDNAEYWQTYSDLQKQLGPEVITPESGQITIAIVDGYFEITHPAVRWADRGLDALDWPMQGKDAHGTACAGVAAAQGVPAGDWGELPEGSEGAYPGATILPVRVYDPGVAAHDELALARGIVGAVKLGASVISISLARPAQTSTVVKAAIEFAEEHNRVVVAAAGNPRDGDDDYRVWYPARYASVIAVGAAHRGDGPLQRVVGAEPVGPGSESAQRWSSAYGPELDVVAPGENVPTIDLRGLEGESEDDYWLHFSGTSAAAPVVAGVAARILAASPSLHPIDVREEIARLAAKPANVASPGFNTERPTENGTRYQFGEQVGYGLIERTTSVEIQG